MTPANALTKQYYRPAEASKMLGVPGSTLLWWEKVFPMFNPNRTPKGTRRYSRDDIAIASLIKELLHVRGMKTEAAIAYINKTYRKHPPRNPFKCADASAALALLGDARTAIDDAHTLARIDAVIGWIKATRGEL